MTDPGIYPLKDGRWLVRVNSRHGANSGRLSVSSIGCFKTREEAEAAFENANR